MKKFSSVIGSLIVILLLGDSLLSLNNQKEVNDEQINLWIKQLNDSIWRQRDAAVCALARLKENQKTEKVKIALIDLLKKEVTIEIDGEEYITTDIPTPGWEKIADPDERDAECHAHAEYFSFLLDVVADLRDVRTIPILINFIGGVGSPVNKALAEIGEPVVDPLIELLDKGGPTGAENAAEILDKMLETKEEGYTPQRETRSNIKNALIKALKRNAHPTNPSKEWNEILEEFTIHSPGVTPDSTAEKWFETRIMLKAYARRDIIRSLSKLADKDLIPLFGDISKNDPYTKKQKDGSIHCPVREEAQKAIELIESEE